MYLHCLGQVYLIGSVYFESFPHQSESEGHKGAGQEAGDIGGSLAESLEHGGCSGH